MNKQNQQTEIIVISKYELQCMIESIVKQALNESESKIIHTESEPTIIRGLSGLAKFLNVSIPTAQKLKNKGVFPHYQWGRILVFKQNEVLEAMGKRNFKNK
jgi:hypothetical protein